MIKGVIVKGEADATRKRCYDCYWCQGAITLWCMNDEAVEFKGNRKVGYSNCQFWKPARHINELSWAEKIKGNYMKLDCSNQ